MRLKHIHEIKNNNHFTGRHGALEWGIIDKLLVFQSKVLNTFHAFPSYYFRHYDPTKFHGVNIKNQVQEGGFINHNWGYGSQNPYI